jgi:DNA-binding IscR family transcriptional regulator
MQFNLSRRLGPNALRSVLYLRGLQGRPTTIDWMATDLQIDPAAIISSVALLMREGLIQTGADRGS